MNILFKSITLFIFVLFVNELSAQSLDGKWQADTDKISDKLLDCYYFYPDNKFSYELNQYDGLNRFISLSGTYKLSDHIIEFRILKSREKVGGSYFRDHTLPENDSWAIDDFKIVEFDIKNSVDEADIKIISEKKISIDNRFFYKINDTVSK